MSELRKDPVTGRWVIISTDRRKRPTDFRVEPAQMSPFSAAACPFCEGHEHMTTRELLAHRNGTPPDGPGWTLRVVPVPGPACVCHSQVMILMRFVAAVKRQSPGRLSPLPPRRPARRACGRGD